MYSECSEYSEIVLNSDMDVGVIIMLYLGRLKFDDDLWMLMTEF